MRPKLTRRCTRVVERNSRGTHVTARRRSVSSLVRGAAAPAHQKQMDEAVQETGFPGSCRRVALDEHHMMRRAVAMKWHVTNAAVRVPTTGRAPHSTTTSACTSPVHSFLERLLSATPNPKIIFCTPLYLDTARFQPGCGPRLALLVVSCSRRRCVAG